MSLTNFLPVTLDCIIFGLQNFGGISNYWAKVVDHASLDPSLAATLILPKTLRYRDFDAAWPERLPSVSDQIDVRVARYLSAPSVGGNGVFHTSYYRLPRRAEKKSVVSVYDFTYERYRSGVAKWVHSKQKISSIQRADAVLCISESTRRDVFEFCPAVDPALVYVVPLGIDLGMFFQESQASAEDLESTVLFVGQRGGYKRFDLAVEAVRQLPQMRLGVVGSSLTEYERTVLKERLGVRWREFGPVTNQELRRLYSSAFALVFPSNYEGFGLPILEAMACGCPVIAAPLSSLPEVGGAVACYPERQDGCAYAACIEALTSTDVRAKAVRGGLEHVQKFPWSRTLGETIVHYKI